MASVLPILSFVNKPAIASVADPAFILTFFAVKSIVPKVAAGTSVVNIPAFAPMALMGML